MIRCSTADIEVSILVKACPTFVFFCLQIFISMARREGNLRCHEERNFVAFLGGRMSISTKTCKYCLPFVSLSAAVCLNGMSFVVVFVTS